MSSCRYHFLLQDAYIVLDEDVVFLQGGGGDGLLSHVNHCSVFYIRWPVVHIFFCFEENAILGLVA